MTMLYSPGLMPAIVNEPSGPDCTVFTKPLEALTASISAAGNAVPFALVTFPRIVAVVNCAAAGNAIAAISKAITTMKLKVRLMTPLLFLGHFLEDAPHDAGAPVLWMHFLLPRTKRVPRASWPRARAATYERRDR